MEPSKVQIKLDREGKGSVIIDGQPITNAIRIETKAVPGEVPTVTIEILAINGIEVELESADTEIIQAEPEDKSSKKKLNRWPAFSI